MQSCLRIDYTTDRPPIPFIRCDKAGQNLRINAKKSRRTAALRNIYYLLFFSDTMRISRSRIFMYSQITVNVRPKAAYHSVFFG